MPFYIHAVHQLEKAFMALRVHDDTTCFICQRKQKGQVEKHFAGQSLRRLWALDAKMENTTV
jgi:hypothetical protein